MDISALTKDLSTALIPVLPYLLRTDEKTAEGTGKKVNGEFLVTCKGNLGKTTNPSGG